MSNLLEVDRLVRRFGQTTALKEISFDVKQGDVISILGPSGCGKSTLLQLIAGLQAPDGGEIRLDGVKAADRRTLIPPERRPVNMVFQDYALWPHMTVAENIAYGLRRMRMSSGDRKRRTDELLELLQLKGLAGRLPGQISGGQQQRVGIARALATQPKLLLMDEPLSNLDVKLRMEMRSELASLLRMLNITALHVTHDTHEAFALADRLLILKNGTIEQFDTPQAVCRNPASPWVASLLGYSNQWKGRLAGPPGKDLKDGVAVETAGQQVIGCFRSCAEAGNGESILESVQRGSVSEEWNKGGAGSGDRATASGLRDLAVDVMVHPDDIALYPGDLPHPAESAGHNRLACSVKFATFEGRSWRMLLEAAPGVRLSASHPEPFEPGSLVQAIFPADKTLIYGTA